MSEESSKNPKKKGFTVPVLKSNVKTLEQKENEVSQVSLEKPKKPKKKETNNKLGSEEEKNNTGKQKTKKETNNKLGSEEEKNNTEKQKTKKELNKKAKETEKEAKELKAPSNLEKKQQKKPEVSLTESQYEAIFNAVLSAQQDGSNSQINTPKDDLEVNKVLKEKSTPNREKGDSKERKLKRSNKDSHVAATPAKQAKKFDAKTPPPSTPKNKTLPVPELSPWGSHFNKQQSQGSSIFKELQESQSSLMNSSALLSPCTTSSSDSGDDVQGSQSQRSLCKLSQVSGYGSQGLHTSQQHTLVGANQRERLQELQRLRNVGVWVYCCRMSCQKQRYLSKITDPQDVPDIWYCHMNPDPKYNSCECEEQKLSAEEEADMIYNQFTAGSLVWARVDGFPWWPAMVDDDPDLEQYYWLEEDFVTVTYYHVVFFDEVSVTRAWVNLKNISPYKKHNKHKQRVTRGVDYTRRIMVAREQANDALTLNTTQRLSVYSFISRYEGPITTSAAKVKKTMAKYKLKVNIGKKEATKCIDSKKENKSTKGQIKERSNQKEKRKINEAEKAEKRKGDLKETKENVLNSKKAKVNREHKVKKNKKHDPKVLPSQDVLKNLDEDVENASKMLNVFEAEGKMKSTNDKIETEEEKNVENSLNVSRNSPTEIPTAKMAEEIKNTMEKEFEEIEQSNEKIDSAKNKNNERDIQNYEDSKESSKSNTKEVDSKPDKVPGNHMSPLPSTSTRAVERKTPSDIEENLSQKSKSSGRFKRIEQNTEDTFGNVIEPSQNERGGSVEDSENKLSQCTISDFFGLESEDAVVPDGNLSEQSQPFEE